MNNAIIRKAFGKLLALACLLLAPALQAASHTWSGAVNGNFSTAGNWSSGGVPTLAETNVLVFPAGASRFTITNNIGALKVSAFNFSGGGYIVRGPSTFTIEPNLINIISSGGSNTIESSLSFVSSVAITVNSGDAMVLSGALSGTNPLVKFGDGPLYFRGAASNPFSGSLNVFSGELHFQKSGFATPYSGNSISIGSTNVGDPTQLFLYANDQIPDGADLTIHPSGALILNGFNEIVDSVTMHSGYLDTGAGTLGLNTGLFLTPRFVAGVFPNPNIFESPTIYGTLEFHGAASTLYVSNAVCNLNASIVENGTVTALNKTGAGTLRLGGGGNFTGQLNIQQGAVQADLNTSLGSPTGLTTVSNGASLILSLGLVTSESLVLAGDGVNGQGALQVASGTVECFGNVLLTNSATVRVPNLAELQLKGAISGAGGLKKIGEGELHLAGLNANTFTGASFINGGKLSLFKPASTRAIASVTVSNAATLALESSEQIDNAGVISVHTGGAFTMANFHETIGGLNLGAGVTVDSGTATLTLLGDTYVGAPYSATNTIFAAVKGRLSLGGALRKFSSTPGSAALTLDCEVLNGSGTGGIWLTNGSIYLLRSNSFAGPVIVNGYCAASNSFAFGASGGGVILSNAPFTASALGLLSPDMTVTGEALTNLASSYLGYAGTNAWNGSILTSNNLIFESYYPGGRMTVDGSISGSGSPWLYGGTLRLLHANSYAGITENYNGILDVRHPQALGTAAGGTLLGEGSTLRLELPNGAVITNESLIFEYTGGLTGHTNNLILVAGAVSNVWTGPVTLPIPAQVRVADAAGTFVIGSTISGPASLEKQGSGKLILAGANANTYAGETVVTDGTLVLNKPNGVQAVGNLTVNNLGNVVWVGSEQIADAATLTLYGGTFSGHTNAYLGSHDETLTDLALRTSILTATTGALTLLGHVDLTHGSIFGNFNRIHATVRLAPGDHQVFNLSGPGPDFAALSLVGSVHETGGSGGLTILNCGLQLHGSNSFSGPVIVNGSVYNAGLSVHHPHALGSPAQGTLLTNSATLDLAMPSGSVLAGESLVLANRRPGAQQPCTLAMYGEFTNTWAGPITLLETNWVQITFGSKLTVDGPVFGPAILNSIGNGELVLAGSQPNTITGLIMEEGILRLAKPPGVPAFLGDFSLNTDGFDNVPPKLILEASGQFPPQATARLGQGGGTNALFNLNGHAATIRRLLGFGTVAMGAGTLTISNATAQYSDFLGRLESAPGGLLRHQGIGTQRGGTFALNGATWLQGGTMYFDTGFIDQGLDISAGAVMDMFSPLALFGSLSGAGKLITSSGIIYVGANNASTIFSGLIEGGGNTNLVKIGTGALTLAGTSTHGGKMVVWDGALLVNGTIAGPVHVERFFGGVTATLGGNGVLQNATIVGLGARLSPGATLNVPSYGKLTAVNVAVVDGAIYACEIGGTNAGVNLDQIQSTDTFTLSGVTLTSGVASFTTFGAGVVSNRYAVVKSFAGVNGTFSGKSEGSSFSPSAGRSMQITYVGGASGHDIVLMDLSAIPPGSFSGTQVLTNGHVQVGGTGTPDALYEVQANANLNTTNWVLIGTALANFNGAFTFVDTNAPSFPMRFYRFLLP